MLEVAGLDFTAVGLNRRLTGLPIDQPDRELGLKLALLPSSSVEGEEGWEPDASRLGLEVSLSGGGLSSMELCEPAQAKY